MKHFPITLQSFRLWTFLLCIFLAGAPALAQGGITVFSDTVSVLEDVDDAPEYDVQSAPPAFFSHSFFADADDIADSGILDFFSSLFGISGFFLILLTIVILLLPLALLVLAVWLLCSYIRGRNKNIESKAYNPQSMKVDEELKGTLVRQSAVKTACWGVALIVIGWITGFTDLLYVAGVVLLCVAAGDWLSTKVKKKNK